MGTITITSRRLGQTMTIGTASDGSAVMEAVLEPGARVPPHRHLGQDERFEVLEGRATMRLGRRRLDLEGGETLEVPAGVGHAVRNAGAEPLRLSARLSPGLRAAEFFTDLYQEADAGHVTPGGIPSPGAFARLARKYGDELPWLPVLPLWLQRRVAAAAAWAAGR